MTLQSSCEGIDGKTDPRSFFESTGNTDTEFAVDTNGNAFIGRATDMQCHASLRTPNTHGKLGHKDTGRCDGS